MSAFFSRVQGARRNALAFALGVCATLALPPFFIFPMLIPAFSGLYLLIGDAKPKRAFWDGWFWGWGFYISGLYWFCIALLTDAEKFGWMIPFALFGITAVIALYNGLICYLWSKLPRRGGVTGLFLFCAIWAVVEFARGHLFTGFPWNLAGYSFAFSDASIQLASIAGAYGLTWFAVWLGAVFAPVYTARIWKPAAVSYLIFAALLAWGAARMDAQIVPRETEHALKLRLVQANIAQEHKWDPKSRMDGLNEHIRLSHAPGVEKIDYIVWPETAIPFLLEEGSPLAKYLAGAIPAGKFLISGALRAEGEEPQNRIFNSMVMLDSQGRLVGRYDKRRLVPFGEFIPFRALLPDWLMTPVGIKDFSHGDGVQTVSWQDLPPLSPLICYEAIFPGEVTDDRHPPRLLLNLTNDAWFGRSSGPYQHYAMARMRAVEEGIPLVRVANTGITALIDTYGRTVSKMDLGKKDIMDVVLPVSPKLSTIYSQSRFLWFYSVLLIALVLIFLQKNKRIP